RSIPAPADAGPHCGWRNDPSARANRGRVVRHDQRFETSAPRSAPPGLRSSPRSSSLLTLTQRAQRRGVRNSGPGNAVTPGGMPAVTVDSILALPRIPDPDPASTVERPVLAITTAPKGVEGEGFPVRRAFYGLE